MDEKTEELRDIFVDVTDGETVTESQTEQRGSLLREGDVDDRLEEVIERMRERFDFATSLSDGELRTVVRGFYDGDSDDELAAELEVSPDAVVDARMDLHLVRERDTGGLDTATLRERVEAGASVDAIATDLEADAETVERALRALQAEKRASLVSQRFRTEFEEVLTDADIAVRLTADVHDDGLDGATEGMEVDVDF